MEHYAPHPTASFEGWYSKFALPSGAHLALIICSVPQATTRPPHMLSITYVPKHPLPTWQREIWVPEIQRLTVSEKHAFELRVPGYGSMKCDSNGVTEWDIACSEFSIKAKTRTGTQVPWGSGGRSTPEGWFVKLPLPLHWHVHSLASVADFHLEIPEFADFPTEDGNGACFVHLEKNWATSFPEAHVWIQARDGERGVCLAGGRILGMTAFLIGFRSPGMVVDFKPPWALGLGWLAPGMDVRVDYGKREFEIDVRGWWRRVRVRAIAERDSFFRLSAPFEEGHRGNFCTESFEAGIVVEVWERRWWFGDWGVPVRRERFEGGSLEFGGEYYGDRGDGKSD